MKKTILLVCIALLIALVSCATSTAAKEPEIPQGEETVEVANVDKDTEKTTDISVVKEESPDVKYAGKFYNQTKDLVYESLDNAIAACAAGDSLIMYADATLTTPIGELYKNFSLDLNGHTIDGTELSNYVFNFIGTHEANKILGKVELKNGTIKGYCGGSNGKALIRLLCVSECVVTNVNVISSGTGAFATSFYANNSKLVVDNTSENACVGKIVAFNDFVSRADKRGISTDVTINGGSYTEDPNGTETHVIRLCGSDASAVRLSGSFDGTLEKVESTPDTGLIIEAGTYGFDPTSFVDATKYSVTSGTGVWTVAAK